jgi:hypothetical protein
MKNTIKYMMLALLMVGLTNCEGPLEEVLYDNPELPQFYQNAAEADLALGGIYSIFWTDQGIYKDNGNIHRNDYPTNIMNENVLSNGAWDTFDWTSSTDDFLKMWEGSYKGINRANTLIDRISLSESMTTEEINEYKGKAKFLRALNYFNLVTTFGGVPLQIEATLQISDVAYKPRNTEAEVYAQIIKDLTEAETEIGAFDADDQALGHVTLGSVKGLLAKVYLQNRQWAEAAVKAKEVMNMGVYALYPDYADIWDPSKENGSEHLFSVQHGSIGGDGNNNIGNHTPRGIGPSSYTPEGGGAVRFADGSNGGGYVGKEFFDATPNTHRKWWTMRNRMPYYWEQQDGAWVYVQDTIPLGNEQIAIVKYNFPDATGLLNLGVNVTVQRYSDILLIMAEAENEANGVPSIDAYEAINRVRRRARAVGTAFEQDESVYPDLAGLDQAAFREALLLERAREFIAEGDRRLDLLRHDRFISEAVAEGRNAEDFRKLYPLPLFHVNQNDQLEQNQGY